MSYVLVATGTRKPQGVELIGDSRRPGVGAGEEPRPCGVRR